jgi:hypothetical protein
MYADQNWSIALERFEGPLPLVSSADAQLTQRSEVGYERGRTTPTRPNNNAGLRPSDILPRCADIVGTDNGTWIDNVTGISMAYCTRQLNRMGRQVFPHSTGHATGITFQPRRSKHSTVFMRMPSPQRTSPIPEPSATPPSPSEEQHPPEPNQFVEPELLYGVCEYRRMGKLASVVVQLYLPCLI